MGKTNGYEIIPGRLLMGNENGNKLITKNWPIITIGWTVITVIVLITVWLLTCLHAAEAKADRANTRIDNMENRLIRIEGNQDEIKTLLINRRKD